MKGLGDRTPMVDTGHINILILSSLLAVGRGPLSSYATSGS